MTDPLTKHTTLTNTLYADPHNPHHHLARGIFHHELGFSDLAAADAYRALSLLESVVDPDGCEFHARRVAVDTKCPRGESRGEGEGDAYEDEEDDGEEREPITKEEYDAMIGDVYALLVRGLVECGCLRDAFDFATRGLELLPSIPHSHDSSGALHILQQQTRLIKKVYIEKTGKARTATGGEKIDVDASVLPAQGFARRVLYPWNDHEPNRKAPETLALLNERLKDVAPMSEVRAVALPALHNEVLKNSHNKGNEDGKVGQQSEGQGQGEGGEVSIQLGLFAKQDIPPGTIILHESSMLTATNRLHDDLCDACNAPLPSLSTQANDPNSKKPVACAGDDCEDTIFCCQTCHDTAQITYHGAICGLLEGLEAIGRDIPDPKDKADYLYLLLLGRALAMAETQGVHPLDLPEVKYIWGDFHDYTFPESDTNNNNTTQTTAETAETQPGDGILPFSFNLTILQPTRLLEEMGLDPFAVLPKYDTWILNTLYAKFRGTASGRLSTWDGGPELCAVHPLWCLANHSCDPNVRWEWGGEICFAVRGSEERPTWKGWNSGRVGGGEGEHERKCEGIKKDEEILNHYCDIGLDVKERREWARGALGGVCLCKRCVWESEN